MDPAAQLDLWYLHGARLKRLTFCEEGCRGCGVRHKDFPVPDDPESVVCYKCLFCYCSWKRNLDAFPFSEVVLGNHQRAQLDTRLALLKIHPEITSPFPALRVPLAFCEQDPNDYPSLGPWKASVIAFFNA